MIFDFLRKRGTEKKEILPPLKSFEDVIELSDEETQNYLDTLSEEDLKTLGEKCVRVDVTNVPVAEHQRVLARVMWLYPQIKSVLRGKGVER